MWEVSWRRNRNCNILTQVPLTIAALLPHSAGLLNRGPEGPSPLSGAGSHYGILSPTTPGTHCLELNSACLDFQLTQTVCGTGLYNWHPPASRGHYNCTDFNPSTGQGWYLWYLRRMHLTAWSRANMLHHFSENLGDLSEEQLHKAEVFVW